MTSFKPETDLQKVIDSEIKCAIEFQSKTRTKRRIENGIFVGISLSIRLVDAENELELNASYIVDIYFHQHNSEEHHAALELRDAVLRLRRDGAFVAVPLFRVNTSPIGPHPVGSYEIWVPIQSFASMYSYLALNRGDLSILVHPLTCDQRADHEFRNSWMGKPYPLDLTVLPIRSAEIPVQYTSLKLGYSSTSPVMTPEERRKLGANVEHILTGEKEAARAPRD